MEGMKPEVESSTKIYIGSTVLAVPGMLFGSGMLVSGSLLEWRADRVLGIYGRGGWSFSNLTPGDGRLTLAAGVILAVLMTAGLLLQDKHVYAVAVATSVSCLGLAIYEIAFVATRPGITGVANGLYLVLGGSVVSLMCALGSYVMMAERGAAETASGGRPPAR